MAYKTGSERSSLSQESEDDSTASGVETTLLELLSYYEQAGFGGDSFVTEGGLLLCGACSSRVAPDHVSVHSIRRLEGPSDPADAVGVLAVICPVCGSKSTCVLKFGPEATLDEAEVWSRTIDRRSSDQLPGNMAPGEDDPDVLPAPQPQP